MKKVVRGLLFVMLGVLLFAIAFSWLAAKARTTTGYKDGQALVERMVEAGKIEFLTVSPCSTDSSADSSTHVDVYEIVDSIVIDDSELIE